MLVHAYLKNGKVVLRMRNNRIIIWLIIVIIIIIKMKQNRIISRCQVLPIQLY